MTEKKKKDGRGGYRPGAGRKPIATGPGSAYPSRCRKRFGMKSVPYPSEGNTERRVSHRGLQLMKERYGDASPEQ